ncbi:uncharacterized protein A1O5_05614 [Cladophialophora psammophila CBS 110553]|uniref:Fucose-specific lectin n=1 Tax=Cladophialophora psammophila CBS 110553 TaxID=1182543 RepID=W9XN81_9EURO|nr:uncharacterized protein A1O5_05614 [Cladophialophora psammophila CBS 110553]EXJ71804.1 hypothetical protein A1O5_05614 [Cladophialophora psammophila CBS 110553]
MPWLRNIQNTWLGHLGGGSVSSDPQSSTAPHVTQPPSYTSLSPFTTPRTSGLNHSTGPPSDTGQSERSDASNDITPDLGREIKRLAKAYAPDKDVAKIDGKGDTKQKYWPGEKEPAPHEDFKSKALVEEPSVIPTKTESPPSPSEKSIRRQRRCVICVVLIIGVMIALLAGIITTAVLLTRPDGPAVSNSTSTTITTTVTSVTDSTQVYTSTLTSTTILSTTDTLSTMVTETDTTLTTSVILATHTASSAQPSSTSSAFYLGGFDAVVASGQTNMFYTDQSRSVQHIYDGGDGWERSTPTAIASNVKPGSPITASLVTASAGDYSEIYVFYIDTDNKIRAVVSSSSWSDYTLSSLELKVADSMFIRSCVPDSDEYSYHDDADLYLYFASQPAGRIRKYGYSRLSATWKELFDLPPVTSLGREVECQFMGGYEALWMADTQSGLLQQWWRSKAAGQDWTLGVQGADPLHPHTSLLSLSAAENNRTHIIFQSALLDIRRYDISGLGTFAAIDGSGVIHTGTSTPGTRLTTWANSRYCGEQVAVYYQVSDTSELHYQTFQDSCYLTGYYDEELTCYVTEGDSKRDRVMPLVTTYGKIVHHHKKYTGWAGFGLFVAACAALGVLICLCAICAS